MWAKNKHEDYIRSSHFKILTKMQGFEIFEGSVSDKHRVSSLKYFLQIFQNLYLCKIPTLITETCFWSKSWVVTHCNTNCTNIRIKYHVADSDELLNKFNERKFDGLYMLSLTSFESKVVFSTFLQFTSKDQRATKVFNLIANSVALSNWAKTMTFGIYAGDYRSSQNQVRCV
jgi:hypothetical protein